MKTGKAAFFICFQIRIFIFQPLARANGQGTLAQPEAGHAHRRPPDGQESQDVARTRSLRPRALTISRRAPTCPLHTAAGHG
ncbi:hypothetical protein P775_17925 [Puniceibacterium antarcticum]|uniref:Uncharacterized protein n=1 Tax=Puniceibacterium antarcticum TaxID=1206336 RepID=A0A2G8RAD2_9RHOB|nr:hypothetical protein P775_17925 [Puniceibacterium antarcticum]